LNSFFFFLFWGEGTRDTRKRSPRIGKGRGRASRGGHPGHEGAVAAYREGAGRAPRGGHPGHEGAVAAYREGAADCAVTEGARDAVTEGAREKSNPTLDGGEKEILNNIAAAVEIDREFAYIE